MKNSTQTTLPHFNFSVTAELNDVTSTLIILINEEINEANCIARNSAKLDRRTKQHTQFGVSTSDGFRDTALTKSWRKKKRKKNGCGQNHIASPTGLANNQIFAACKSKTARNTYKLKDIYCLTFKSSTEQRYSSQDIKINFYCNSLLIKAPVIIGSTNIYR